MTPTELALSNIEARLQRLERSVASMDLYISERICRRAAVEYGPILTDEERAKDEAQDDAEVAAYRRTHATPTMPS